MKSNNRMRILEAVIAIIERDGLTAVTFDAVAAETGITRGGLIYHFRSRDELVTATHEFQAERWRLQIEELAARRTNGDLQLAYILSGGAGATRADIVLMLDSVHSPEHARLWSEVRGKAAPAVPTHDDQKSMARFIAGLASDGLWLMDALDPDGVPDDIKRRVLEALIELSNRAPD